jgi:hypothetical protein
MASPAEGISFSHLFSHQLATDASIRAAILGTESGARFLCGPHNHWYSGGRSLNKSFHNCSANWQTTQTPGGRIHRPPAFRCRKHLTRLQHLHPLTAPKPGNRHAPRSGRVSFASFSLRFKENEAGCRAGTRRFYNASPKKIEGDRHLRSQSPTHPRQKGAEDFAAGIIC